MKRLLPYLFFLFFFFFAAELLSLTGLYILKKICHIEYQPVFPISQKHKDIIQKYFSEHQSYLKPDPALGWTIRPNSESKNHLYRSNSDGIRADRNYPMIISQPGCFRLAAFGDSFSHCDDVANSETWEAQLESIDSHLEILNFGVSGYGLDQAFLRYKEEGEKFHPHIIFIGFMSENINRLISTFRPFYFHDTTIPLAKPRFILYDNQLFLLENPISTQQDLEKLLDNDLNIFNKLKAQDYYVAHQYSRSPCDFLAQVRLMTIAVNYFFNKNKQSGTFLSGIYNSSSEAYKLTTKLIDEFYLLSESRSSLPIILLFPQKYDIEIYIKSGKTSYLPLVEYLENKGYRYIDLMNVFKASIDKGRKIEELIPAHNSAEANKLIAQFIYSYLQANHLLGVK